MDPRQSPEVKAAAARWLRARANRKVPTCALDEADIEFEGVLHSAGVLTEGEVIESLDFSIIAPFTVDVTTQDRIFTIEGALK